MRYAIKSKLYTKVYAAGLCLLLCATSACTKNESRQRTFSSASFVAPTTNNATPVAYTTITDTRSWRTPTQIDAAAVTDPPFDYADYILIDDIDATTSTNLGFLNGQNTRLPVRGVIDKFNRTFAALAHKVDETTDVYNPFIVYPYTSFFSDSWISTASFENFIAVGAALTTGAGTPTATHSMRFHEAPTGDVHFLVTRNSTAAENHLFHTFKRSTSTQDGAWINSVSPTQLSTTGAALLSNHTNELCQPRMTTDSSADGIAVWCATTPTFYYNIWDHSAETWSTAAQLSPTSQTVLGATYDTPAAHGVDMGVDSTGSGFAVYVMNTAAVGGCTAATERAGLFVRRYTKGVGFVEAPRLVDSFVCAHVNDVFVAPRIWVRADGSSSIFYYRLDGATSVYSLYRIDGTTAGVFGSPTRVDDAAITSSILVSYTSTVGAPAQILQPGLAHYGTDGTVAYVKPSVVAGVNRLFVSQYSASSGTWSTPVAIDSGDFVAGVGWFDVAAGPDLYSSSRGQFVYTFEGLSAVNTPNLMRGRVYSSAQGGYTTETTLGGSLTLLDPRPTAVSGPSGVAGILFLGVNTSARRAYVQSFR